MSRSLWFACGFAAAWLLVAFALWAPIGDVLAGQTWFRPAPTMIPIPTPTLVSAAEPTQTPTVVPRPKPSLEWRYQGLQAGDCGYLAIDAQGSVRYAPCDASPRAALLTPEELAAYQAALSDSRGFEYAVQPTGGGRLVCRMVGRGDAEADVQQQADLARWARSVFYRLVDQEREDDHVAAARLDLAARFECSPDDIATVAVSQEIWPDACLGIHHEGIGCAEVETPGYRIVLEQGDAQYEYRSDMHGRVMLAE